MCTPRPPQPQMIIFLRHCTVYQATPVWMTFSQGQGHTFSQGQGHKDQLTVLKDGWVFLVWGSMKKSVPIKSSITNLYILCKQQTSSKIKKGSFYIIKTLKICHKAGKNHI